MSKPSLFKRAPSTPPAPEADVKAADQSASQQEDSLVEKLQNGFDAAYYLSQNPDVAAAGIDPLTHYNSSGWREGRAPNSWFRLDEYLAKYPHLDPTQTNPFLHFLLHKDTKAAAMSDALKSLRENQFLYWTDLFLDVEEGASPVVFAMTAPSPADLKVVRAHFDAEYYLEQNPDVVLRGVDALLHYMTIGWIEMRDPEPGFSTSFYLRNNQDIARSRLNPYLHYHRAGKTESWRKSATVAEAKFLDDFAKDDAMQARIAQAKALEPMVALPNQSRRLTSPLMAGERPTDVAKALRLALGTSRYHTIIAVPHVRMSGASRVASIFTQALAQARDPGDILVVTTDSSEAEYIGWFPDGVDRLDLSAIIEGVSDDNKIRMLVDLARGVGAQTLVNVNSKLMWEAMRIYGRQMSNEFRIVTYLFTWDENPQGDRVGYPIQWLRDTADHHHLLLTDTENLARDVSERLGFGHLEGETEVRAIYTPAEDAGIRAAPFENGRPRVLWAGRFDPQKRVDILIAVAKDNPTIIFDVYGKAVLDKVGISGHDIPSNIELKGTYKDLNEVLTTPYAGFLYTAQWDGLPTILLDMAAARLPIVASNVGGIAEMINEDTGWLVDDIEDISAYSAALRDMVKTPQTAQAKAAKLAERLDTQFAPAGYIETLKTWVAKNEL